MQKKSVFDCPHFVLLNNQFIVSKEDKLTLPKVVYNRSSFVQVVQVCKVFQVFLLSSCGRRFDFQRSSFKIIVASLVLFSFLVLFCFVSRFLPVNKWSASRICNFFALNDDLNVDTHFVQQTLAFAYIWSICALYLINSLSIKLVSHR